MPQTFKSGDDITHLMTAAPTTQKPWKSGDDVTHLMNQTKEEPVAPLTGDTYDGPDSFIEGVLGSGHDVMDAMGQAGMGFLKGALDIPATIKGMASDAYHHPAHAALAATGMGPMADALTGVDSMAPLREASANAGSNPDAFGRIMGQMAGQPLVTAGAIKAAPSATRMMGTPVAAAGRIMSEHQPISGSIPFGLEPRLLRTLESAAGSGIERIGEWMRKPAPSAGEIMPQTPDVMEGDFNSIPTSSPVNTQRGLPASPVDFYGPEHNPVPPMELPPMASHMELPPSTTHYTGPSSLRQPSMLEGMPEQGQLPPSNINYGEPSPIGGNYDRFGPSPSVSAPTVKPKMRMNSEGNIVDLQSGHVMDATGKTISYPSRLSEIMQKSFADMTFDELRELSKVNLDKSVASTVKRELAKRVAPRDSPFFFKNRK